LRAPRAWARRAGWGRQSLTAAGPVDHRWPGGVGAARRCTRHRPSPLPRRTLRPSRDRTAAGRRRSPRSAFLELFHRPRVEAYPWRTPGPLWERELSKESMKHRVWPVLAGIMMWALASGCGSDAAGGAEPGGTG